MPRPCCTSGPCWRHHCECLAGQCAQFHKNAEKKRDSIKNSPQLSAIECHINRRPDRLSKGSGNAIDREQHIEKQTSSVQYKMENPYRIVKNIFI